MLTQQPGEWQSLLRLVMSLAHVTETVVSSWKSSRALLGQVRVPVAFLEHSKPETPVPLTHVSNLGDYSTDTRKTASNVPGASL